VLLLAFAGVLFAMFLMGIADLVHRHARLSEGWSLGATVLALMLTAAAGAWLLIPSIAEQTDQLRQTLPQSIGQLEETVKQYPWGRWILKSPLQPEGLIPKWPAVFSRITGIVSGTLEAIGIVVVIFFTGLFVAAQPRLYQEGIVKLVTPGRRDRARDVLGQVGTALRWWLIGKLSAMVLVGVLTWVGLWLLGVEIAVALAVLAAVLTFIPNFGPIIAAIPAVLVGLLDSPTTAVWVVALYVAIQTVESYVFTPLIQQQAVSIPPALVIIMQLALAVLVGGIGLALATPLTVTALVLARTLYVEDMLGDQSGV
jgi:predicted PurR-regulated permease PerM